MDEKKELTLTRLLDADRETVWKYWTDPQLVQQWWGPHGVTNPTCEWDVRPEGNIHIVMLAGEKLGAMAGQRWPMTGTFEEVQKPDKLVFTANAIQNDKEILQHRTTVLLTEENGKTNMTVHIVVTRTTPEAAMALQGMEAGWNQQLDKLAASFR